MLAHIRPNAEVTPWQFTDLASLNVTRQRAAYEALWIEPNGKVFGGAQAIAKILISAGSYWRLIGWIIRLLPFRWIAHWVYRIVANNRQRLPGGTPTCALPRQR
jgi:predicted DCC family thiol-disulfide oxidoreductase YuxK